MPHCHPGGVPRSGQHRRPSQQRAQTAHHIGHSCCCPNSEPPRCLAIRVSAISPQQSAQRSHPEHCIGHWCSHPNTQWCHRIVGRWSGHHLRRSQQSPGRRIALPLVVVAPTHHRAIKTDGERVLLPSGHRSEHSIWRVQNSVGVGLPTHQRASYLTKRCRRGNQQGKGGTSIGFSIHKR